jgi:hypothetical protein
MAGKPEHKPTHDTRIDVEVATALGNTQESIAKQIGIDVKTLYKYYRKELDSGKERANAKVARFLWDGASGQALKDGSASYADCARLAMFYAKTQMGFSEKDTRVHQFDLSNLTNDQLEAIANGRLTSV